MFLYRYFIFLLVIGFLMGCNPSQDSGNAQNENFLSLSENYDRLSRKTPGTAVEFECTEDPLSGRFFLRLDDESKVYQYSAGFEHGSVFLDVFTENNEIRIVKFREEIWKFDENAPSGEATATEPPITHTVDEAKEYLYFVSDKNLVKAQARSAVARSIQNESIEAKINQADWSDFSGDSFAVHYQAGLELIRKFQNGSVKKDWCGLNLN